MKEKHLKFISVCVFEDVSGVCEDTAAALHFPEQSSLPVFLLLFFVCLFVCFLAVEMWIYQSQSEHTVFEWGYYGTNSQMYGV